ncbi:hypothetical protein BH23CHL2_BH23CHL2_12010 [soil metagenome]
MRLLSFGSGSSGNAFLIDTGEARVMFDCGVGIRRLRREMTELGVAGTLDAVFITHEHIDHVRALQSLLRYESCQVFASNGTFDAIGRKPGWTTIRAETHIDVAGLEVTQINVLHDAAEPLGFFIDAGINRIALFTDLGAAAPTVASAIAEAMIVVLESNYCEAMLRPSQAPHPQSAWTPQQR